MAVRKRPTLAESADHHALYEASVQCAETEIDFVDQTFRELRGWRARSLREDFCGTAGAPGPHRHRRGQLGMASRRQAAGSSRTR